MPNYQLLKLIINESVGGEKGLRLLYQDIVQLLWEKQFPGVTVMRSDSGIDSQGEFHFFFYEDIQFNQLPVIIETVHEKTAIQAILPILKRKVSRGELTLTEVQLPIKECIDMANQHTMLRIYIQEEKHWFKEPLYQKILSTLQQRGFLWSTITKGIEGFGHDHVIHKQQFFSFSEHTPVIIEAVGGSKTIESILPELKLMVKDGLIITMPIQVHSHD